MGERQVSLTEAQERLPELVDDTQRGETLAITRNGKEVARLTPPVSNGAISNADNIAEDERARRAAIVEEFMRESAQADWERGRVTLEEIREWRNEGRA